jgi:hypothetical protein
MWVAVTALTLVLFIGGIPARFERLLNVAMSNERILTELGFSAQTYALYFTALDLTILLAHVALALIIFRRKSDDWMALFVSLTLVVAPLVAINAFDARLLTAATRGIAAAVINYLGLTTSLILLYLFPDGRFVPRSTRGLALIWAVLVLPAVFSPNSALSLSTWPDALRGFVLLAASGSGAYAQIYRYLHVSDERQRQQTKWAFLGLLAAVLGPFGYFTPFVTLPSLSEPGISPLFFQFVGPTVFMWALILQIVGFTLFTVLLLVFPLSVVIGILRFGLFDIGVLVNRTLVYGALTAVLALVYYSSVVLLQQLFRLLTGQTSDIAIVVSTLAIAALFSPLRRRVQAFIDRRFYRRKYDAAQTLATFSATLRDEVDLNQLTASLLTVVEETMQPAHVSLWLRKPERKARS